jgi:hypothetical protein
MNSLRHPRNSLPTVHGGLCNTLELQCELPWQTPRLRKIPAKFPADREAAPLQAGRISISGHSKVSFPLMSYRFG